MALVTTTKQAIETTGVPDEPPSHCADFLCDSGRERS